MGGELRIVIDGTMARGGGGHTYLANLVPLLEGVAPAHRFRVLVRSPRLAALLPSSERVEIRRLPEVGWGGRIRFAYGGGAAREAADFGADVYYAAGELAPRGAPCPVVAAFRNPNVFTAQDQGWPWPQRLRLAGLRTLARLSAARAARILFVSRDSAAWIGDRIGLPPERRAVVHHGVDPRRFEGPGRRLHPRPYILSVSSVYRYKNFVRLIEGWTLLARELPDAPDLVILGDDQDPAYSARMRAARGAAGPLAERIHLLGEVPYEEVGDWYRGAFLFAFPSLLETFGHPLLEAMAAGVPVIAGDIPVSREVAGEAALYVAPHDTAAFGVGLRELCQDPAARDRLRGRGAQRVQQFGWRRSAEGLVALLAEVAGEASRRRGASPQASQAPARDQNALEPRPRPADRMPAMRLLVTLNGPVVGRRERRERLVNRHTAGFLLELAREGLDVSVAGSLVDLGEAGNLSDFDVSPHPELRVTTVPWPAQGAAARGLAYLRALPWVVRETRRADSLYVFLPSHLGMLFVAAARLLGRPYGVYLRGSLHEGTARMQRALGGARYVLATTSLLADAARAHCRDADVVTPMMELRLEDVADEPCIREEPPFRILFVGRIEAAKGLPEMLEGLAESRRRGLSFGLDLAGTGPEIEHYRTRAHELGLGDAVFHGMVREREALAGLFRQADLLVLPTHNEGFPRVLYEAMTYGVPVVTTFVGGIPSVMKDGENCVRIPLRDAGAIAEAVDKTLGDAGLRRSIARGGLRTMRDLLAPSRPSHARQVLERLSP